MYIERYEKSSKSDFVFKLFVCHRSLPFMSYQATMAKEKDYIFDFVGKTCKIMTVINHLVYKGQIFWVIFALVADVSQMIPNAERI